MPIGQDLTQAKRLLADGQLVAIPTETVYGLAANALDEQAVARIFAAKRRPRFDPLIVHVACRAALADYVTEMPEAARLLAERFMPGPLTLLLPKSSLVPDIVTSGLPQVAVRVPSHPLTLKLLLSLDFPLAAPSANPFGYVSPTTARHVSEQLGEVVPYILDGGPSRVGVESTIVGFPDGRPTVYRAGGLTAEAIRAVVGEVDIQLKASSDPTAPGQLQSHYATRKPLVVGDLEELAHAHSDKKLGVISFSEKVIGVSEEWQFALSPAGSLEEAAAGLFAAMRRLDASPVELILAERFPEEGLGLAINDRLRRASYPSEGLNAS